MTITPEQARKELERREAARAELKRRGLAVKGEEPQMPQNVQQVEPASQDWLGGVMDAFTQGLSFGFGDELTALESAAVGRKAGGGMWDLFNYEDGESFWDRYDKALAAERAQQDKFKEEDAASATVAEIAGSFATPIGILGGIGKGAYTMKNVVGAGRAALTGMGGGAVYGIGDSKEGLSETARLILEGRAGESETVQKALQGGAFGAIGGAGATMGVKTAAKMSRGAMKQYERIFRRSAYKAKYVRPSIDDMSKAATKAYQKVDDLGIQYDPDFTDEMLKALSRNVEQAGAHKTGDPMTHEVLKGLRNWRLNANRNLPKDERVLKISDLDKMRQYVYRSLMKENDGSGRYYGSMILQGIDDLMDEDVIKAAGVLSGDLKAARPALEAARKAYGRLRKSELLDSALERASYDAAKTGSGGNLNNRMRQEIDKLLTSKRTGKYFTAREKEALQRAVKGTTTANMLRLVGKLSPQGNGLTLALNLIAAGTNPMMLTGTATAMAAKTLGDRATKAAINRARNIVALGVQDPGISGSLVPAIIGGATTGKIARGLGKNAVEIGYNVGVNEEGRNYVTGQD